MKIKEVGKIEHSNIDEYIGKYLKISDINFTSIFKERNQIYKPLDKYKYHLLIKEEQRILVNGNGLELGRSIVSRYFTLIIIDGSTSYEEPLYYHSKYPAMKPVEIFEKK